MSTPHIPREPALTIETADEIDPVSARLDAHAEMLGKILTMQRDMRASLDRVENLMKDEIEYHADAELTGDQLLAKYPDGIPPRTVGNEDSLKLCPGGERCVQGPKDHLWTPACEMDEGWADLQDQTLAAP